jgi:GH15 family glucan-1,4-alpha-glucosidase
LLIPLVGFLPASDPRVVATIEAIESKLVVDGFVKRYDLEKSVDGLAGDEGTFLLCSFWLVDCLIMLAGVTTPSISLTGCWPCAMIWVC